MVTSIYIIIAAAIILIMAGLSGPSSISVKRMPLPAEENQAKGKKKGMRISLVFPFARLLLEKLKLDVKLKNSLEAGHVNLSPQQFFSMKLILMILAATVGYFLKRQWDLTIMLVALSLGYIIPDLWLRQKVNQRKYEIARLLPETVDLLGLCVEAGLDFTTAVKWVIEKKVYMNPMIEELTLVLEEIKWGKPRSQALKDMARRLNIPEVSSFVQALVQAERMGTPVSETFAIISEDTRLQRFRRGERYALQAPIKILLPLIFCILPVIGIIVGGPILLQFMHGSLLSELGH